MMMITPINYFPMKTAEWSRARLLTPRLRTLPPFCGGASVPRFKSRAENLLSYRSSSLLSPRKSALCSSVGGASFAFLNLLVVVTCVGAAIALGQIKSLKSDIAILHREVFPLKERLARLEQAEKTKLDLDQQDSSQNKSGAEKNKPGGEIHPDKTALNLSREEIQLIRDYIKPSPSAGTALPVINVGDQVSGAIIPLPSPLTEKVPKLLGARFTTRNGSIIILRRDSRHADAVLPPS